MLDDIDRGILQELEKDSRLAFAELGRIVGLSPSAVRERVIKMEDIGLIESYSIELNQKLLGNDLEVFILVKVFPGKLKSFLKFIPQLSEIQRAYRITGDKNIHLQVIFRDQIHLQKTIDKIMLYGDTETMLILSDVLNKREIISL